MQAAGTSQKNQKKSLISPKIRRILTFAVTLIALIREVAVEVRQVICGERMSSEKLTTSHCNTCPSERMETTCEMSSI